MDTWEANSSMSSITSLRSIKTPVQRDIGGEVLRKETRPIGRRLSELEDRVKEMQTDDEWTMGRRGTLPSWDCIKSVESTGWGSSASSLASVSRPPSPFPPPSVVLRQRYIEPVKEVLPVITPIVKSKRSSPARLVCLVLLSLLLVVFLVATRPAPANFVKYHSHQTRAAHGWLIGSSIAAWQRTSGNLSHLNCGIVGFAWISNTTPLYLGVLGTWVKLPPFWVLLAAVPLFAAVCMRFTAKERQ
eukprot:TRINITY_DN18052_c0_g1_i1.p1 TRINITY_DN18052_c0_g1~~TRINITY_DN18052_c0_g1_i1.p1  ORF type:complete len:262 (+),score=28.94 TRINITY_DN18052_c0_g1_i1:52-786(+)